jgi:hypothetical protein
MKKVSTAMTQPNRKLSQLKLTIGLDLGDRTSWYCILDESGSVLLEQRLSTTARALEEIFGAMARTRVALETGTHRLGLGSAFGRHRRSIIRWQHRLNRERPTCTERMNRSSRVRMEAWRQRPLGGTTSPETGTNPLTPTALLMEGDST